ncbi:TPA: helix-turn-helix domain-containing protein, partial [Clostridioides difficile]
MFSLNLQEKGEKNMLENLKKEMDRQGVKVKDIANLLGLKSPAISKRIYGTVQLQESEKYEIAKFLNVKKSEFLFRNTGYSPSKKEYSKTTFSERFSMLLEKDGRTQKEISKLLNVNERTISDWKNGKQNTNLEMLKRISNTLGVSFAYLSGESDFYP